jgi:hypothetical protein
MVGNKNTLPTHFTREILILMGPATKTRFARVVQRSETKRVKYIL